MAIRTVFNLTLRKSGCFLGGMIHSSILFWRSTIPFIHSIDPKLISLSKNSQLTFFLNVKVVK